MNKKITYFLLALFVLAGILFFVQLNRLSFEARGQVSNLEIPIIVICILAIGVGLAFPALLYKEQKKSEKESDASTSDITSTNESENHSEKFSLEKFQAGLAGLKNNSQESKFWYFCEYFKVNLACLFSYSDTDLQLQSTYGIVPDESLKSLPVGQSLAALSIQSGKIEVCEEVPEAYFTIQSGLGDTKPSRLLFVPIQQDGNYLLELASFWHYEERDLQLMQESAKLVLAA